MGTTPDKDKDENLDLDEVEDEVETEEEIVEEESDDELEEEAVDETDNDAEAGDDLSTSQESDEVNTKKDEEEESIEPTDAIAEEELTASEEIPTELPPEENDAVKPTDHTVTAEESAASKKLPTKLSPEESNAAAPTADASHIKPTEAMEIQVPEVFLHAEYRKGTGASVAKMPILVTFEVGRKSIRLGDLETLQEGFIFECENPLEMSVNICANGQLIGKGSLLNIEGRIGVRVTEIY